MAQAVRPRLAALESRVEARVEELREPLPSHAAGRPAGHRAGHAAGRPAGHAAGRPAGRSATVVGQPVDAFEERRGRQLDAHLLVGLSVMRLSYVLTAIGILVVDPGAYRRPWANALMLLATVGWSGLLVTGLFRRPRWARRLVAIDVVVAVACMVAMEQAICVPSERLVWGNWAYTMALSTGTLLGATMPWRRLILGIAPLGPAYALPVVLDHHGGFGTQLAGNLASFVWFPLFTTAYARHLRRGAARLDAAVAAQVAAEREQAAAVALAAERQAQQQVLHDTVLATLTSVARGTADLNDPALRLRAGREAELIRRMLATGATLPAGGSSALVPRLRVVSDDLAGLGLQVVMVVRAEPSPLPEHVATVLSGAVREALNNVSRHAGVDRAWLTVDVPPRGGVALTVVDRGTGFDPATPVGGFGLRRSLGTSVTAVGGSVSVESSPGEGTVVSLAWSEPVPHP